MAREMIFHKYYGTGSDYLIFDVNKNRDEFDKNVFRKIHNRNFGLDLAGVLVGPYMEGDNIHMKVYNSDGDETSESMNDAYMFSRYLKDAGYEDTKDCKIHTSAGEFSMSSCENLSFSDHMEQSKIYCWC
ncbi:MAG: hypothetical protein ACI4TF_16215 [Oliverpabstia sp.]